MKVIDADELKKLTTELSEIWDVVTDRGLTEIIAEIIDSLIPVVHAHWIYVEHETPSNWSYRCTNCLRLSGDPSEYCPYCGAKMDEEVNDD